MKSKRIGTIYEGRWKIVSTLPRKGKSHKTVYVLENIYNGNTLNIDSRQMQRIEAGLSSISRIIAFRRMLSVKKRKKFVDYSKFNQDSTL